MCGNDWLIGNDISIEWEACSELHNIQSSFKYNGNVRIDGKPSMRTVIGMEMSP